MLHHPYCVMVKPSRIFTTFGTSDAAGTGLPVRRAFTVCMISCEVGPAADSVGWSSVWGELDDFST